MEPSGNPKWDKGDCDCPDRHSKDSILYSLLSGTPNGAEDAASPGRTCEEEEEGPADGHLIPWLHNGSGNNSIPASSVYHYVPAAVQLCFPEETCQQVALLLLKTVEFVRTLPIGSSFLMPDRVLLFQHNWSELLALTMAQHKFEFEVEEVQIPPPPTAACEQVEGDEADRTAPSQLQLCPQGGLLKCLVAMKGIPTKCDVDTMNTFFRKCDSMLLDDKEFAYLKATLFFSSDVPGLTNPSMVESHQSQAQLRLGEYESAMYPSDPLRFAHILLSLPPLRNIRSKVMTQLFFQDLIGDAPMEELLKQMLTSP